MKKSLLLVMSAGLITSASAQNDRLARMINRPVSQFKSNNFEPLTTGNGQFAPYKPQTQTAKTALSAINVGSSGNPYGYFVGGKSHLWADPQSGLVAHVHRTDDGLTGDGNTGFLRVSYSKDRGATWTQDEGPAFTNDAGTGAQGATFSVARYPQTAMYNPYPGTASASVADSTYILFQSAVRDNTNSDGAGGDWGAHGYGVYRPASSTGTTPLHKTQHQVSSAAAVSRYYVIPDDFHATQDGHTWTIDIGGKQISANPYQDTIYLDKGTWNPVTRDMDMSLVKVYAPVNHVVGSEDEIVDAHIAFAPSVTPGAPSLIGWLSILGHDDYGFQPDSIYYPILYKTVDGGNTWTGPIRVDLDNLPGLTGTNDSLYFDATANPTYRHVPQFRHDLAVDYLGRPHLTIAIGVINYDVTDPNFSGWSTTRGAAMTTIWADDATGTTWSGKFLAWPMAFYSCYGDCDPAGANRLQDYNRPQIATTWDGKNMFYCWSDADTAQFGSINASAGFDMQNPDIWLAAHDLIGNQWSSNSSSSQISQAVSTIGNNVTKQTAADAQAVYANLSYYVFQPTAGITSWEVPLTYSEFDISASGAALAATVEQHKYLRQAFISVGVKESPKADITKMNVYPNPTNGTLNINYSLNSSSSVSIELFNLLGEKVAVFASSTSEAAGGHNMTVDLTNYNAGVYFLRSNVNGNISTVKITKN